MDQDFRKWICIGVGFGAGAILMASIITGGVIWYSSRPKPWDDELTAHYERYSPGSMFYTLENPTGHDFTPTEQFLVMCRTTTGVVSELPSSLYEVILPSLIPAGKKVQLEFHAPASFSDNQCPSGFILYDRQHHYQINLPQPVGVKAF